MEVLDLIIKFELAIGAGLLVYVVTKPLVRVFCDWRIQVGRERLGRRVDEIQRRYESDRMFIMDRTPHFRKGDDGEWYVRGPLEALGGQTSVTVKRKDNTEVVVDVDPDTLMPVPSKERTLWDGRKPHTVKVLWSDSPDWMVCS